MLKEFPREMKSLEKVFDFLHSVTAQQKIKKETLSDIDLAVEEIFSNMVKYNALATERISVSIEPAPGKLSISLIDPNSTPFDLTKAPDTKLPKTMQEMKPGGLGIQLVKRLMDSVQYQFEDGKSRVTVTKRLE